MAETLTPNGRSRLPLRVVPPPPVDRTLIRLPLAKAQHLLAVLDTARSIAIEHGLTLINSIQVSDTRDALVHLKDLDLLIADLTTRIEEAEFNASRVAEDEPDLPF
jgi:hypothetical protein